MSKVRTLNKRTDMIFSIPRGYTRKEYMRNYMRKYRKRKKCSSLISKYKKIDRSDYFKSYYQKNKDRIKKRNLKRYWNKIISHLTTQIEKSTPDDYLDTATLLNDLKKMDKTWPKHTSIQGYFTNQA